MRYSIISTRWQNRMQKGKRLRYIHICLAYEQLQSKRKTMQQLHCRLSTVSKALDWLRRLSPVYVAKLESIFRAEGLCKLQKQLDPDPVTTGFLIPVRAKTKLWRTKETETVRLFTTIHLKAIEGYVSLGRNRVVEGIGIEQEPWEVHVAYPPYSKAFEDQMVKILPGEELRVDLACSLPWRDENLAQRDALTSGEISMAVAKGTERPPDLYLATPALLADRAKPRTSAIRQQSWATAEIRVNYVGGNTDFVLEWQILPGGIPRVEIPEYTVSEE